MQIIKERTARKLVSNVSDWRAEVERMAALKHPQFFHLRAQLPARGRTNEVVGASSRMNVVLKTYASGGENELHAHSNEDHMFLILQGRAVFYGPRGEEREVAKNDCILFPAGSFYWFMAKEDCEPLVLLRIGAVIDPAKDVMARIDSEGNPFAGDSEKNKEVALELYADRWYE